MHFLIFKKVQLFFRKSFLSLSLSAALLIVGFYPMTYQSWIIAVFIFFCVESTYTLHRLVKYNLNLLLPEDNLWMKQNRHLVLVLFLLSSVMIILIFFLLELQNISAAAAYFALLCFLALGYVIPFPKKNLRSIPFVKSITVSLAWTILIVVFPSSYLASKTMLFFPLMILFLILAILGDWRDKDHDTVNLRTLPQVFSYQFTQIFIGVLLLSDVIISFYLLEGSNLISISIGIGVLSVYCYFILFKLKHLNPDNVLIIIALSAIILRSLGIH